MTLPSKFPRWRRLFPSVAILALVCANQPLPAQTYGIYRELWTGLNTNYTSLNYLTNTAYNTNWPDRPNPAHTRVFANFETETNTGLLGYRPNTIASDSRITFVSSDFNPSDIGNPQPPGTAIVLGNGRDLGGGGAGIGGTSDQFQFNYQLRTGDFDVKVRLVSLGFSDAWAKAGLMARESLAAAGKFAGVFSTPTLAGAFFEARTATQGNSVMSGSFSPGFPLWLRLQRMGTNLTGFAGLDGNVWVRLGSTRLTATNLYLGFAVTSHDTNQTTTAQFRDFGSGAGGTEGPVVMEHEPLGLCSRRTGLVISEILFAPRGLETYANSTEFVELFNANTYWEDLGGYRLSGSIHYTFPDGTVLPGGGFLVVARNPDVIQSVYGLEGILGPWEDAMALPADNGKIQLLSRAGAVLLDINYRDSSPWPVGADGTGHSIVMARPSYGEGDPRAWSRGSAVGGSPGCSDPYPSDPLRNVLINEFLAHSDAGQTDFVELYNHGTNVLDLSGCTLSDDPATARFVIPAGTTIPARGYVVFCQTELGFGLGAAGETIYFKNSDGARVLDAVKFEAQGLGISTGRFPDGAAEFYPLQTGTPGARNSAILVSDIVINEVMYKPISLNTNDQYIELFNRSAKTVNLAGWRFAAGVDFTFPSNTFLAPAGCLVVAKNIARLLTNYSNLTANNAVGNFTGKLSGQGERLALARPEFNITTDSQGQPKTNTIYVVVDEVTFNNGGRWGQWANEGGSSLELIDPDSNHRLADNWADSDETHKAPWTNVEWTGVLDLGVSSFPADAVHLLLLGAGECLVDEVEVLKTNGVNLVVNSNFETSPGATWFSQGTHERSHWETNEGYLSGRCLRVVAVDRGDTGPNKIRSRLNATLPAGARATLRTKVRWLKGFPEMLVRLHGNYLEAVGRLAVPPNLGSPGQRNSRAVSNAPPAIYEVAHYPILPAASQSVLVTARAQDSHGLSAVTLKYRVDPATAYTSLPMADGGAGGDVVAGDGIYSATLPGQTAGKIVAFAVQATDTRSASSLFPGDAPARECLVRFGETMPPGSLPVYRIWTTKATADRWAAREKLSNSMLDGTFVYGDRRAIYNAGVNYKGSPFLSPGYTGPTGAPCGYALELGADDPFLGAAVIDLDFIARDPGAVREQIAHWMLEQLGAPFNRRNFIRLTVNGVLRESISGSGLFVYEDCQKPGGDFLKCFVPNDTEGELFKLDDGFEFNDAGDSFDRDNGDPGATIENFTSLGAKKVARYRWHWRGRAYHGTANDYTNVFALVDAANLPNNSSAYAPQVDNILDVEEALRTWVVERIAGNWDSYGYNRGKNMYAYKPEQGKWMFLVWDIDFPLGAGSDGATKEFLTCADPVLGRFYTHPPFKRAQYRILRDAVNGPLLAQNVNPVIDARFAALTQNKIGATDDMAVLKQWIQSRRNYIVSLLNQVETNFAANAPATLSSNLVTLTGTAPVNIKTIRINGCEYPLTWTSVTGWRAQVPLGPGTNQLIVRGFDEKGNAVTNAPVTLRIDAPAADPSPAGAVVINEVMFDPALPGAEYVELYNTNANVTFDLSGWQIEGLEYAFPSGSYIRPLSCLVLARDRVLCSAAYGASVWVCDIYPGALSPGGGTLALIKPGATSDQNVLVHQVRYAGVPPWDTDAAGTGSSLQLLDASQDATRPCNWFSSRIPPRYTDPVDIPCSTNSGWRLVSTNANFYLLNRLTIALDGPGEVYIDDLCLVTGTNAGVGSNFIRNGGFEAPLIDDPPLTNSFIVGAPYAGSQVSPEFKHSGNSSLRLVCQAGVAGTKYIYQDISPAPAKLTKCTLSFWYLVSTNATNLTIGIQSSTLGLTTNVSPIVTPPIYIAPQLIAAGTNSLSPGLANPVAAPLPPIPPLWLNEVQFQNLAGITNQAGQRAPWIELYNSGANVVSLAGLRLSHSCTNLEAWAFPAGGTINPGEFKIVFADGRSGLSTPGEPHTSFQLPAKAGSVALSWTNDSCNKVLDYVDYSDVPSDWSFGSCPDGQAMVRQPFFYATPGQPNNPASAPLRVFINEWLASNKRSLVNPASGEYDDCFELYNAGDLTAHLDGYYLATRLTNQFLFQIPNGYAIPAHGFLRVWADKLPAQNSPGDPDLHVNFNLSKSGEGIGLFTASGDPVDYISYGAQTTDVSAGRCPDGGDIVVLSGVTLGGANTCPTGTMPVVTPVGDQNVYPGETLVLQVLATDSNSPPETLTYSLEPGAPAGAVIDPASDRFTWTVANVTPPCVLPVTVRVTDNGTPSASATGRFSINVLPPPRLLAAFRAGANLDLTWSTVPGRAYRVLYKDNLTDPVWLSYGSDLPATSNSITATLNVATSPHRFFRIQPAP